MNPEKLFDEWQEKQSKKRRDALSAAAAEPYRLIWRSWCDWLAETPVGGTKPRAGSYRKATADHVVAFLKRGQSEVTRRRYWRVLQRIYAYALDKRLVTENPADLEPTQLPASENPEGLVLNGYLWGKLPNYLPKGLNRTERRDRAILLLFMDLALTPQEVCRLRYDHLGSDFFMSPDRVTIQIDAKRSKDQERELAAGASTAAALLAWAADRIEFKEVEPKKTKAMKKSAESPLLFVTLRGTPMSRFTLFHLVSRFITEASEDLGIGVPEHDRGPLVLRNTRLVQWLNAGRSPEDVIKDAGLQDTRALLRLRNHLDSELQARLWPHTPPLTSGRSQVPSNQVSRSGNHI